MWRADAQVGAGTGYWTALLQHMGADVLAFDKLPPSLASVGTARGNRFVNYQYTEVQAADSVALFQQQQGVATSRPSNEHSHRALLLIYPENPVHVAMVTAR